MDSHANRRVVADNSPDATEFSETSFYRSSNNLNSRDHAKNFRNSLFLSEDVHVEDLKFDSDGNLIQTKDYGSSNPTYFQNQYENTIQSNQLGSPGSYRRSRDIQSRRKNDNLTNPTDSSNPFLSTERKFEQSDYYGSDFDEDYENNYSSNNFDNEVETQAIHFGLSPSLSSLAGVLKNNVIDIPKVDTMDRICEDEEEYENEEEEESQKQKENVNPEVVYIEKREEIPVRQQQVPQQRPSDTVHQRSEKTVPDAPVSNSTVSRSNSTASTLPSKQSRLHKNTEPETQETARNPAPLVQKQPSTRTNRTSSITSSNLSNNTASTNNPQGKKKSIFSIFKKKQNISLEPLPVSETFSGKASLLKSNRKSSDSSRSIVNDDSGSSRFLGSWKKLNRSRTSIADDRSAKDTLHVKKNRSQSVASTVNTESSADSPVKRGDIGQRKPTPLDFNKTMNENAYLETEEANAIKQRKQTPLNFEVSPSKDQKIDDVVDNETISTPKIAGEDLFPKFLDSNEIESIKSLEKNRLSFSSRNGSKRRSLNDSISINAQNEGMYVEEAGDSFPISTPDLTKSPASSILRGGRFDDGTNRSSYNFSDGSKSNRNSFAFSDGNRSNRNSTAFSDGNKSNRNSVMFSETAISTVENPVSNLQPLPPLKENYITNEVVKNPFNTETINSSTAPAKKQDDLGKDPAIESLENLMSDLSMNENNAVPLKNEPSEPFFNTDFEDSEYVSEIMEFASIIDFGGDLDLDLDLNPAIGSAPNVLGLHKLSDHTYHNQDDQGIQDFRDETQDHKEPKFEAGKIEHSSPNQAPANNTETQSLSVDLTQDESSALNEIETNKLVVTPNPEHGEFEASPRESFSPTSRAYIPENTGETTGARPLSMSFKGLHHSSQLNQSSSYESDMRAPVNATSVAPQQSEGFSDERLYAEYTQPQFPSRWEDENEYGGSADSSKEFSFETDPPSQLSASSEGYWSGYPSEKADTYKSSGNKKLHFSSKIILYETYAEDEYDRRPELATCNQLTPQLAMMIRDELNELKSSMEVHPSSEQYTHFF
ncbi:hypothetical protein ACO0QE_000938 [Hanseniaspora vineae]